LLKNFLRLFNQIF